MSKSAPKRHVPPQPQADYVSARFRTAITFTGMTIDQVGPADPFTLTHTAAALIVRWRGDAVRELPPQTRMVPWCNVACAEPRADVTVDTTRIDYR